MRHGKHWVEVPTRDYTSDELRVVYECLDAQQQFEWIDNYYNDGFNYEPLFESDLFLASSNYLRPSRPPQEQNPKRFHMRLSVLQSALIQEMHT